MKFAQLYFYYYDLLILREEDRLCLVLLFSPLQNSFNLRSIEDCAAAS